MTFSTAIALNVVWVAVWAVTLTACSEPRFVDTACTAFTPITYSAANDTEATKSQIRGHNAAWGNLCK